MEALPGSSLQPSSHSSVGGKEKARNVVKSSKGKQGRKWAKPSPPLTPCIHCPGTRAPLLIPLPPRVLHSFHEVISHLLHSGFPDLLAFVGIWQFSTASLVTFLKDTTSWSSFVVLGSFLKSSLPSLLGNGGIQRAFVLWGTETCKSPVHRF